MCTSLSDLFISQRALEASRCHESGSGRRSVFNIYTTNYVYYAFKEHLYNILYDTIWYNIDMYSFQEFFLFDGLDLIKAALERISRPGVRGPPDFRSSYSSWLFMESSLVAGLSEKTSIRIDLSLNIIHIVFKDI